MIQEKDGNYILIIYKKKNRNTMQIELKMNLF